MIQAFTKTLVWVPIYPKKCVPVMRPNSLDADPGVCGMLFDNFRP